MSRRFNDVTILRRLAAILIVCIIGLSNLFDMYMCASVFDYMPTRTNGTVIPRPMDASAEDQMTNDDYFASAVCTMYPSYYSNYAILILIATSMVSQLTHICKFGLMLVLAGKRQSEFQNIVALSRIIFSFDRSALLHEHFSVEGSFPNRRSCLCSKCVSNGPRQSLKWFDSIVFLSRNRDPALHISLSALLILISIALGFLSRHVSSFEAHSIEHCDYWFSFSFRRWTKRIE